MMRAALRSPRVGDCITRGWGLRLIRVDAVSERDVWCREIGPLAHLFVLSRWRWAGECRRWKARIATPYDLGLHKHALNRLRRKGK